MFNTLLNSGNYEWMFKVKNEHFLKLNLFNCLFDI